MDEDGRTGSGHEDALPVGALRRGAAAGRDRKSPCGFSDSLLMDEPFGAVDAITRAQLQDELKGIHQKTGIAILTVTHDIEEALKLGTKVLVMDHGEIQQYGAPKELLQNSATDFSSKLVESSAGCIFLPEGQLKDCEYCGAAAEH